MKHKLSATSVGGRLSLAAAVVAMTTGLAHAALFSENFNSLAGSLGPSVNERISPTVRTTAVATDAGSVPIPNAFSHTGPAGWTVDNSFNNFGLGTVDDAAVPPGVPELGNPLYGVDEWEGWSFADKVFWYTGDDQTRSSFTKGVGTVAVADSDEWDDLRISPTARAGFMDTGMTTGNINVAAHNFQVLDLTFDSSWRPEAFDDSHVDPAFTDLNNQSAVVYASFDGDTPMQIEFWDSNSAGGSYKPDAQNETVTASMFVPGGATNLKLTFGYFNAANDWWWAVDNLALKDAGANTVWSEDFESVTLGDSVNERLGGKTTVVETTPNTFPYPDAFTHTPPSGWNIDNSGGLPGIGDPAVGVEEWEGWSFANPKFWTFAAMEGRQLFTKGTGVVAVADPDEWDDLGNPEGIGTFNSMLETPSIDISSLALAPGALSMKFDSSWDDEDTQTAIIEVDYGSGYVEVLRWESDPLSPFFHDTNYNETVLLALDNPLGATTARIRFGLVNSTDDWWWAVDNIRVGVIPEPATTVLISLAMSGLALFGFRRRS